MEKNKSEKKDKIVYCIFIVYLAMVLFFAVSSSNSFFKEESTLKIFFQGSLIIQILIIIPAIVISIHLHPKKSDTKLSIDGALLDKEKEVMRKCRYYSNKKWKSAKETANEVLAQFILVWIFIWVSWLFLYIVHLIKDLCNQGNNSVISFFLNPLSNANTLMLLICYLVLYEVTKTDDQTGITGSPNWAPWVSLFLFITFLEIMLKLLFQYSAAANNIEQIFNWISGITSGAVMALFVGRFDSEFIKPRFIYLFFLYLYMAIQAISPVFMNYQEIHLKNVDEFAIKLFISITTLVCKLILFLFVLNQIKSRRLLFYFIRMRRLHYDVKDEWRRFKKKHSFTDS